MSIRTLCSVWALVLCSFFFSSTARAGDWNTYDWGTDITYFKEQLLATGNLTLTDWQWFPGSGTYNNGDYSDDQFCFPMRNNDTGSYTIYYGMNGAQSCEWWGGRAEYSNASYVNYYDMNLGGTVQIDCSNPLNDSSCPGYQEAYTQLMCSTNPLYDQSCPGYAQAYFDQQCSVNPLYDQGCTGYAEAFYAQQCSLNPLYDSGCPGYAEAYYAQQCTLSALYDSGCPGYAEAYATLMVQEAASGTSDESTLGFDDGTPAADGSDIVSDGSNVNDIINNAIVTTPTTETVVQEDTTGGGADAGVTTEVTPVETTPTVQETVASGGNDASGSESAVAAEQESSGVAVTEEKIVEKSNESASSSSSSTASSETKSVSEMSPKEVVGMLSKLGVLGNEQTNGVGDATGLSQSIAGTGGTMSITGQATNPDGSPNTMGSPTAVDPSLGGMPSVNGGVPGSAGFGTIQNNREETLANGSTELEQSMGFNVNPLFNDSAISGGVGEYAQTQTTNYERASQTILKNYISKMLDDAKQEEQANASMKDAEDLVKQSIQDSIDEKADELMSEADKNQAEIVALMGTNIQFNDYKGKDITEIDFYGNEDWYKDKEIPQNRRALRNGLAQQILHEKMVDMQYPE